MRSRTRNVREQFWRLFGYCAYRCHQTDCLWRGLLKKSDASHKMKPTKITRAEVLYVLLISAAAVLFLLWYLKSLDTPLIGQD